MAIRWLLQKDIVASVIIGARTVQQLDSNMAVATGWALTPEEVRQHTSYTCSVLYRCDMCLTCPLCVDTGMKMS